MSPLAVDVSGLVKRYGKITAVDGLSFAAEGGRVTALLGPNGAGKTTTVEVCEGYRRADAGTVRVLGRDPRDRSLRARVGVMLQSGGVPNGARTGEYLRLIASFYANPLDPAELLGRLDLAEARRTPYRRLSGGQQQRLALAAALVGRPELVFLDEPTAGLDPHGRHDTWELIEELRASGVSVILCTHHMDEAERLADKVIIVDRGVIIASGTPAELTGAERQLRFRARPGLDLDELLSALPAATMAKESPSGHYVIEGDLVPSLFATVTAWCASHGVTTEDLRIERRTLEDVFLELTGRELRASATSERSGRPRRRPSAE